MDINDLNKSQLILLAVLLSFVTSIATGITTVTLMQQAPPSFTVPVNRVIQQTVEKIQQVEGKTTVQTVVVKEEDLVVDAIEKNQSAGFAVSKEIVDEEAETRIEDPVGRGFVVSADGIVVADGSLAGSAGNYYLQNASGKFKAEFLGRNEAGFSFLKIGEPVDGTSKATFTVPSSGDLEKMKVGQKVLVLGSSISSFIYEGNKKMDIIVTKSNAGGMVLNLDGEVLGIALLGEGTNFAPIKTITDAVQNL